MQLEYLQEERKI